MKSFFSKYFMFLSCRWSKKIFLNTIALLYLLFSGLCLYGDLLDDRAHKSIGDGSFVIYDAILQKMTLGHLTKAPMVHTKQVPEKSAQKKKIIKKKLGKEKKSIRSTGRGKIKIAIVIQDVGLSRNTANEVLKLPNEIYTISFNPYAGGVNKLMDKAYKKGFEIFVNLPMQPEDYLVNDPGPHALLENLPTKDNLSRLEWSLAKSKNISGVLSQRGEIFTNFEGKITPIFDKLKIENKIFIYGGTKNKHKLRQSAAELDLGFASIDMVIDDKLNEMAIIRKLDEFKALAMRSGSALALINAYPVTIRVVQRWASKLDTNDFEFLKVTNFIQSTM